MTTGRALLVGVDRPQIQHWTIPALRGAANDVRHMKELLRTRGFEVTALVEPSEPSADEVKDRLREMVAATGPGEVFVFYFAGHGVQLPTTDVTEPDGYDEALVMADATLLDDDFRDVWHTAREGAYGVVVVDACHSASAAVRRRGEVGDAEDEGDGADQRDFLAIAKGAAPPPAPGTRSARADDQEVKGSIVWLSACRDDATTSEEPAGADTRGRYTTRLIAMASADPAATYAELQTRLQGELDDCVPPLVEGADPGFAGRWPAFSLTGLTAAGA